MATMMLLQPTDMSNLGDIAPTTMIEYVGEIDVSNHDVPDAGNLLMAGTTDLSTNSFTANTVTIDNEDDGVHSNLLIYDLAFLMSSNYISTVVQDVAKAGGPTHLSILLSDVLANDDTISGSSGIDHINAYAGDDIVHGGGGNDTIDGFSGNDRLMGDAGNDRLIGNLGKDILIGGRGADQFCSYAKTGVGDDKARDIIHYVSLADSGTTAVTRDSIFGFIRGSSGRADRIDLSAIDANPSQPGNQAFHLVTKFTAAHAEVHLVASGPDTLIQVDGDKDAAVDMTILVRDAHLHAVDLIL